MDDYIVRMMDLPGDIHAVCVLDRDGIAMIYINSQLSPEARRAAFDHEMRHVARNDFFNHLTIQDAESGALVEEPEVI